MILKSMALVSFLFVLSCSESDDIGKIIGAAPETGDATYRVTFTSLWNATDHISVPGNAHFTSIVPVIHNSNYHMFEMGQLVSAGMESLAETGSVSTVNSEIAAEVTAGTVLRSSVEAELFLNMGSTVVFEVSVSESHPLVSFATMIAPSPDWIVGQDSLELFNEGAGFVSDTGVVDLFAYNAGTEDGDTGGNYSLGGADTNPQAPVSLLTGAGFDEPFATVQFEKIN